MSERRFFSHLSHFANSEGSFGMSPDISQRKLPSKTSRKTTNTHFTWQHKDRPNCLTLPCINSPAGKLRTSHTHVKTTNLSFTLAGKWRNKLIKLTYILRINPPYRLTHPNCPQTVPAHVFIASITWRHFEVSIGHYWALYHPSLQKRSPSWPGYLDPNISRIRGALICVYLLWRSNMAWKCPLYLLFTCLTLDLLLSHFNLQYSRDTLNIKCRFDSCDRDYTKINSLVKHVRNKHRVHLYDSGQSNGTSILGE